ncbi:lipase 3-like [Leguminivora glycinivorella]|uniref:lipase 3-like n=1 Tax=Leguminivora glycinivorella TaxID=1035111 RepID=UPI00200DA850|nr:lipase 3-like [Leguminivora glycinivorella]
MVGKIIFLTALIIAAGHGQLESFWDSKRSSEKDTTTSNENYTGFLSNTYKFFNSVSNLFTDQNTGDEISDEYKSGFSNEDCHLTCDQLIAKYGHPVETHDVITEDGYILKMVRIPSEGPVVFLQHGLLGSADDYLVAGPDNALAYLLAKNGYDVWLANSRGCKYSRNHTELDPSESAFWDFSWHELGYYDLPAMIDYTLNVTGRQKLKYIGHSQGTTAFWVLGSERPEYMEKIERMIALSPIAFTSHMKSPLIRFIAPTGGLIHSLAKSIGLYELAPDNTLMALFRRIACSGGQSAEVMCTNLMFLATGYNIEQLNMTNLPVILSHVPSGASAKQFAHYGQGIMSAKFRKFDYGEMENLERYGSREAPDYDLSRVSPPVSLVYSDADWLCDARDVDKLHDLLPDVVDKHRVQSTNFNHMDYVFAKDVKRLIYEPLSEMLTRKHKKVFS